MSEVAKETCLFGDQVQPGGLETHRELEFLNEAARAQEGEAAKPLPRPAGFVSVLPPRPGFQVFTGRQTKPSAAQATGLSRKRQPPLRAQPTPAMTVGQTGRDGGLEDYNQNNQRKLDQAPPSPPPLKATSSQPERGNGRAISSNFHPGSLRSLTQYRSRPEPPPRAEVAPLQEEERAWNCFPLWWQGPQRPSSARGGQTGLILACLPLEHSRIHHVHGPPLPTRRSLSLLRGWESKHPYT